MALYLNPKKSRVQQIQEDLEVDSYEAFETNDSYTIFYYLSKFALDNELILNQYGLSNLSVSESYDFYMLLKNTPSKSMYKLQKSNQKLLKVLLENPPWFLKE